VLDALLAGLFGLLIGSFLNVCIYRLPRDVSVSRPARSFCPVCERTIAWYDNVPLISFAILRGRCRHCAVPIPWRYPVVEAVTGAAFAIAVARLGLTLAGAKLCLFSTIQIALFFTDLESRLLPDEFTLGGMLAGIALAPFAPPDPFFGLFLPADLPVWALWVLDAALSGLALGGAFWAIGELYERVRKREGLGFGDVKMAGCNASFLGLHPALLSVALGSVIGSAVGLGYIWLTGRDPKTYYLPFGSFLAVGGLVVGLWLGPF
jgi:leader peptidase (prepilin peptidase)/N-methyltransferase